MRSQEEKPEELILKAKAVKLILDGKPEEALVLLSKFYKIRIPVLKIGLPKRLKRAKGCYDSKRKLICLRSSSEYRDPFVVLHEFYHHLRNERGEFSGSEKNANVFALNSIIYFKMIYGA